MDISFPKRSTISRLNPSLLADKVEVRLAVLRSVTAIALLAGIALSPRLWFPVGRSFPRVPIIPDPSSRLVPPLEYMLSALLLAALAGVALSSRPKKWTLAAIALLIVLVSFDQMRLQPWVYQYSILLTIIALHDARADEKSTRQTHAVLQLIVAMLYVWSGAQKLNYSFSHEVLPQLFSPVSNYLALTQNHFRIAGPGVALIEIFIGAGLLLRRVRVVCLWAALVMHGAILALLIAADRNSVVWPWNGTLMVIVFVLFWRSTASIRQTLAGWRSRRILDETALLIGLLWSVLPLLSFWGWWDSYLSGSLYSGRSNLAVIRLDQRAAETLPDPAKRQIFNTSNGDRILPLYEWSLTELNVPPYPEQRIFRKVAREVCQFTADKERAELVVRGRPAILDGRYEVSRTNCAQLEGNRGVAANQSESGAR